MILFNAWILENFSRRIYLKQNFTRHEFKRVKSTVIINKFINLYCAIINITFSITYYVLLVLNVKTKN